MCKLSWSLMCATVLAAWACPTQAQLVSYALAGTVDELSDPLAVLGPFSSSTPFTLTYLANFSLGYRNGGGGGFGGGNWLYGGTSYDATSGQPTVQISPVSAYLTINGHELDFPGTYDGSVFYLYNGYNEPFGGYGSSGVSFVAETRLGTEGPVLSRISSSVSSPYEVNSIMGAIDMPLSLSLDGHDLVGLTSFSYVWGLGTSNEATISGTLTPTTYTVALAVPEPATWVLLAIGLAGVAVVRPRDRPRKVQRSEPVLNVRRPALA